MKRLFSLFLFILASFCITSLTQAQTDRNSNPKSKPGGNSVKTEILTNESIISLVQAGFKEKTILTLIRNSPVAFELSANKLIQLKKTGVNENVIQAMIEKQALTTGHGSLKDEDFFSAEDEAFFKSPKMALPDFRNSGPQSNNSPSKDVDIFGSKSGNQSQSKRSGGLNGEAAKTSDLSGTATVRIIKPSTEGGNNPKLERAPKLTNQGIIEMVQAGFSEGTILRKIESTQVEFDVSSKAIELLHKNRVSEKVIKAMRDAMDETK